MKRSKCCDKEVIDDKCTECWKDCSFDEWSTEITIPYYYDNENDIECEP